MHGVTGYNFSGKSIIKVWLLIKNLIYFKGAFNQAFLASAVNLASSAKFLGSGLKCDTYEPDSPKVGNELFNSFTAALKYLCKPLTILFAESFDTFHSPCVCQIRSRILNLASLVLMSGCKYFPSRMYSRAFVLIDPSSESLYLD